MSLLRRRMMMNKIEENNVKYPLTDGSFPQGKSIQYIVQNGVIHLKAGSSRFCLTTPTVPYSVYCVNNESWLIPAGTTVLCEIDNLCALSWKYRTSDNDNIDIVNNKDTLLTKDIKNIFAIGIAVEGDVNLKFFVNGERWI